MRLLKVINASVKFKTILYYLKFMLVLKKLIIKRRSK